MDSKMYPQGKNTLKSRYVNGSLVFYTPTGVEIYRINPLTGEITYAAGSTVSFAAAGLSVPDSLVLPKNLLRYSEKTISAAAIVGTSAGQLGHAQGFELVAAGGAGTVLELVSAFLIYDYAAAAYTAGGNVTVNWGSGGAALTGLVSAANSIGAAGDKIVLFYPLSTAGVAALTNTGINLVAASAFTQPGTAAGVVRVKTVYRVHTTDL